MSTREISPARRDPPWFVVTAITITIVYALLVLLLPLFTVFYEALQKGWETYLAAFKDQELFLKHNLNARALGALTKELDNVRYGVDELITDLQRSIAEADAFIEDMEKARAGEAG